MGLLPDHDYAVFLSREAESTPADDTALARLASVDAALCERFLTGEIGAPVAPRLTAAPSLGKPNSPEGLQLLEELRPDLIISIRYRRILREAAIAIPQHGVLNLHSGILPDYRGVMATFWAMLAGEKQIGTTLHWIVDSGIDTGPVIGIHRKAMCPRRSYLANVLGLYNGGCDLVAAAVEDIENGREPRSRPQSPGGHYYSAPGARDVQRFDHAGLALFDGTEETELR